MTTETTQTGGSSGRRVDGATVRRLLGTLGVLLLIAAIVPFVIFAVPQVVGGDHGFVVLSGSMEPALSPGDVIIVDESASVGVGDVVTFDDGNTVPTTHRVIGVEGGQYVTQGDANENADGQPVPAGAVLGRVTLVIPLIGYAILWANTPVGYISLVLVPIGLLLLNELHGWATRADEVPENAGEAREAGQAGEAGESGQAGLKPAIRHVDDVPEPVQTPGDRSAGHTGGSGAVPAIDVKLTGVATAALFAYALWNISGDVAAGSPPDPVSVAAAVAGLSGFAFALWTVGSAWLSRRGESTTSGTVYPHRRARVPDQSTPVPEQSASAPERSDGGVAAARSDGGAAEEPAQ